MRVVLLTQSPENLFCAGTYQKILAAIAKPALDGAHLNYLTKVTQVKTTTDEGGKLTVLTEGGSSFEFDEVVVTAPLGWLKQHPDAFSPALPARLTKAIQSIGYGCLEKVSTAANILAPGSEADWSLGIPEFSSGILGKARGIA